MWDSVTVFTINYCHYGQLAGRQSHCRWWWSPRLESMGEHSSRPTFCEESLLGKICCSSIVLGENVNISMWAWFWGAHHLVQETAREPIAERDAPPGDWLCEGRTRTAGTSCSPSSGNLAGGFLAVQEEWQAAEGKLRFWTAAGEEKESSSDGLGFMSSCHWPQLRLRDLDDLVSSCHWPVTSCHWPVTSCHWPSIMPLSDSWWWQPRPRTLFRARLHGSNGGAWKWTRLLLPPPCVQAEGRLMMSCQTRRRKPWWAWGKLSLGKLGQMIPTKQLWPQARKRRFEAQSLGILKRGEKMSKDEFNAILEPGPQPPTVIECPLNVSWMSFVPVVNQWPVGLNLRKQKKQDLIAETCHRQRTTNRVWQLRAVGQSNNMFVCQPRARGTPPWNVSLPAVGFHHSSPGGVCLLLCLAKHLSLSALIARPTFLWTDAPGIQKQVMLLGAELVDSWEDATCHVVDSFSEPGQRVSWTARLNGHLIVTKQLSKGPWIQKLGLSPPVFCVIDSCCSTCLWFCIYCQLLTVQLIHLQSRYQPAGKIATVRNLLVTQKFAQCHPMIIQILKSSLRGGWSIFDAWLTVQVVLHQLVVGRQTVGIVIH